MTYNVFGGTLNLAQPTTALCSPSKVEQLSFLFVMLPDTTCHVATLRVINSCYTNQLTVLTMLLFLVNPYAALITRPCIYSFQNIQTLYHIN